MAPPNEFLASERRSKITRIAYAASVILLIVAASLVLWIARSKIGEGLSFQSAVHEFTQSTSNTDETAGTVKTAEIQTQTTQTSGTDETQKEKDEETKEEEREKETLPQVHNPRTSTDDFHAGLGIIIYRNDYKDMEDFEWKTEEILQSLVRNNINSLSINLPLYQDSFTASAVYKKEELTPKNEEVEYFIREAKKRGFSIMLRPFLDEQSISYDESGKYTGEWRGTIQPGNTQAWFETYTDILVQYALLAESLQIDSLNIGTELSSMERYSENWENLIEKIKRVYGGQLTYSANRMLSDDMPWHMLDFASVDAFYFLDVNENTNDKNELVMAWNPWIEEISAKLIEIKKPLVITELGVASQHGSFRKSWLWDHKTPLDLEAQRLYYEASCEALKPYVSGIYWWVANIWSPESPEQDEGFSPVGKPAEKEIELCFKKEADRK